MATSGSLNRTSQASVIALAVKSARTDLERIPSGIAELSIPTHHKIVID